MAALLLLVGALLAAKFVATPLLVVWLRAHSTVNRLDLSPDNRYQIAIHRYPRLRDVPETLGFGQGYVVLSDRATGTVLTEKPAEDLAAVNLLAWGKSTVSIPGFADWQLPRSADR
jgi:hypothetical protein